MTPSNAGLGPCPFCGGLAHFAKEGSWPPGYRVVCIVCKAQTAWNVDQQVVTALWNDRPSEAHLLRSLEEAREALKPFAAVTDRPYFKHVHDEQRLFIETNAEVVISEDVRGRDFRRARAALASLSQADAGRGE